MRNLFVLVALGAFAGCAGGGNFGDDNSGDSSPGDDGSVNTDGGGDEPVMVPTGALATGITVTGVSVLQGVEVNVVKNGAPASKNAPIVAGRRGMLRVFYTLDGGWSPHKIDGLLTLTTGGVPHLFEAKVTPVTSSTDANFNSTFNFEIDPASFATDTTFLVQLFDNAASGTGPSSAQYPTSGTPTSLGVQSTGGVNIYVFPIHFTNYSAGTPATGTLDLLAYQDVVMGFYPATNVTLTLQPTINYSGPVPDAQGNYWDQLLNLMVQKRSGDSSVNTYYYGAFAPTSDFGSFCGGGCVAGLSTIPSSPSDIAQKASIGLVYGGDTLSQQATGQTMAHEVGHGHGRAHAPTTYTVMGCSTPGGIDPGYPYTDGSIGVWGWNIANASPVDPSKYFDLMGYCAYDWISDYTYSALASWIATDNGADMALPSKPTVYRQIFVAGDGSLTVGKAFPVYGVVSGSTRQVTFDGTVVTGHYYPYDHVPGGYILAPEPVSPFTTVRVAGFASPALH